MHYYRKDGRSPATLATYAFVSDRLAKFLGGVRVREATTARIDAAQRSMRTAHGPTMAKQSKPFCGVGYSLRANALGSNPVRDVDPIKPKNQPKGAVALTADQLRVLLLGVQNSQFCQDRDLADPITLLVATGLRRSELLALQWSDVDTSAATLSVTGKLVRAKGHGLQRLAETKTAAGLRTVALPKFAVDMLDERRGRTCVGGQRMMFPATSRTWRDPNNFGKQVAQRTRDTGRARGDQPLIPQNRSNADRRQWFVCSRRCGPARALAGEHDPGPLHGQGQGPRRGC